MYKSQYIRTFIVLLLCIAFNDVSAQNYLNETARWKQSFRYSNSTNSTNCISERYFIGDTVVNGLKYYPLYYTDYCILTKTTFDSLGNPVISRDTTELTSFLAYIREENKKIYYSDFIGNEFLKYNFDVNDNTSIDSVVTNSICNPSNNVKILQHDTVCIGNIKRKSWEVSTSPFPLATRIIEGVGPSSGFLAPVCRNGCPECNYTLLSFTLNGDTLYKGNCHKNTYVPSESSANVSFFPNPVNNYLHLKSSQIMNKYLLLDIRGQLIKEERIADKEFEVNCENLVQGLYILKLFVNDHIIVNKFYKE